MILEDSSDDDRRVTLGVDSPSGPQIRYGSVVIEIRALLVPTEREFAALAISIKEDSAFGCDEIESADCNAFVHEGRRICEYGTNRDGRSEQGFSLWTHGMSRVAACSNE